MTLWEYLDRRGERMAALAREPNIRILANVIGCSLVFGFLGAMFTLFFFPVPKENETLITYMIGQLSGFAGGVLAYHYGSKSGDKEMDAKRTDNTAKALDAVAAVAALGTGTGGPSKEPDKAAEHAADATAKAATDKAEDFKAGKP